jgi:tetratricopeptide (TPR) repeat protein
LLAYELSRSGGERELVHRFAAPASNGAGSTYLRMLVGRAYEALGERERAAEFLDLAAFGPSELAVLPGLTPRASLSVSPDMGGLEIRDYVRHAIASEDAVAAVGRARSFAQRFPGSGDAQAILGDAEFARGDKAAARAAYARSALVRRSWPLTLRLAAAQEDAAETRRLLESYVRDNPMNAEAAALLADAFAAAGDWERAAQLLDHAMILGMARVPWVLAARSIAAGELDDSDAALDYALAAHELQPMNPLAIAALIDALPESEEAARSELETKLHSVSASLR